MVVAQGSSRVFAVVIANEREIIVRRCPIGNSGLSAVGREGRLCADRSHSAEGATLAGFTQLESATQRADRPRAARFF